MQVGLQSVRCNCLSRANFYFNGEKAFCPVCGKQAIVEWINGKADGIMPINVVAI